MDEREQLKMIDFTPILIYCSYKCGLTRNPGKNIRKNLLLMFNLSTQRAADPKNKKS